MEFDFAKNTSVTDVNTIPSDFRGLYKQDGDKYVLDNEHVGVKSAVSAITGLNNALRAARAEAKNKTTGPDLTPLKEWGDTPEAILAKFNETKTGLEGQIKGVNIEKIKEDLAKEHSGTHTKLTKRAEALQGQLHKLLVSGEATTAISGLKGDVELLMPFVAQQVKVAESKDGEFLVHVVDQAGDIRYSGVTGAPMSIKELVAEMKANERYGKLFASEAANGGGADAGASNKAPNAAQRQAAAKGDMSAMDKIRAGLTKKGNLSS
jgi:hypothetical protein